jgi:hypothetical protein
MARPRVTGTIRGDPGRPGRPGDPGFDRAVTAGHRGSMLRDFLYLITLVGIAAGTALAAPEHPQRPQPQWYIEVCAQYDVC